MNLSPYVPMLPQLQEPIVALATPPGKSAIAVIRLSGTGVISLVNHIFQGKDLTQQPSHTIHLGTLMDQGQVLDEVLVALFKAPRSFTQEESVEISCHGSMYIAQQIIQVLIVLGARLAKPGEFTQRAFLNGRFDLVQAEAVADLIAADTPSTSNNPTANAGWFFQSVEGAPRKTYSPRRTLRARARFFGRRCGLCR